MYCYMKTTKRLTTYPRSKMKEELPEEVRKHFEQKFLHTPVEVGELVNGKMEWTTLYVDQREETNNLPEE